jgi:fibronectin type 3 domain-containing protein
MKKIIVLLFILFSFVFINNINAATVTLEWDASPSVGITGYKIYVGTSSGNYSQSYDAGNNLEYAVLNISENVVYYFAATAYDSWGNESGYSNEISYKIGKPSPPGQLKIKNVSK